MIVQAVSMVFKDHLTKKPVYVLLFEFLVLLLQKEGIFLVISCPGIGQKLDLGITFVLKQRLEQGGILFKFHNMGLGHHQPTLLLKLLKLLYQRASSQT
jgi:hypothetical protein